MLELIMSNKIKQSKTIYKDGGFLTDKSLNNIRQQLQKRGKLNGRLSNI